MASVRLSNLKVGSILIADVWPCIAPGSRVKVEQDTRGKFVPCKFGNHYLDGQVMSEKDDTLVGFRVAK